MDPPFPPDPPRHTPAYLLAVGIVLAFLTVTLALVALVLFWFG